MLFFLSSVFASKHIQFHALFMPSILYRFVCLSVLGWDVAGDHIRSGAGGSDNDYLILNLKVPGFR